MRKHPRLYEISAWPWLERLSREEGRLVTLGDVPPARWDELARGKFDVLFLMGVWRRSGIGREIARTHPGLRAEYDRILPGWVPDDVPGSPYCIQAYEPDRRMGGGDGLDRARRQLADRGIRLILDFVPNHMAFDHAWISSHPERFVLGTDDDIRQAPTHFRSMQTQQGVRRVACGRDPYFDPWTDVAQRLLPAVVDDAWFPEFDERRAIAESLAQQHGALWVPFHRNFEAAVARGTDPAYWADDGVHPTPAGHQLMADLWYETVFG